MHFAHTPLETKKTIGELDELKGNGGKVLKTSLSHDDEAKLETALSAAKK